MADLVARVGAFPRQSTRAWGTIFVVSAAVFLALSLAVGLVGVWPVERTLDAYARGVHGNPRTVVRWITTVGEVWVLLPLGIALFLVPGFLGRRWWPHAAVTLAATIALEKLTKWVIMRPRPRGTDTGFPSGHVAATAAFFVLVAYVAGTSLSARSQRLAWMVAAVAIILVGLSRIVLTAHWPADVVGGAALGFTCASASAWWSERRARRSSPTPP